MKNPKGYEIQKSKGKRKRRGSSIRRR